VAADQVSIRARAVLAATVAALVVAGLGLLGSGAASAAPDSDSQYVKYYTVKSSYQGAPETLSEISQRFLGTANRSVDIFNLNVGRKQPDGGKLSDPGKLHEGWQLVLPWDAVGSGVEYGLLHDVSAPPSPDSGMSDRDRSDGGNGDGGKDGSGKDPASVPSSAPTPTNLGGKCASAASSSSSSDWASLRLAPDQAWSHSRGKGQLVAVVDSGVDGSLPQLGGHVALGSDLVSGSGRGNTDCLGTGTSMASLVVAQKSNGSSVSGLAPDATVLPVRIVTTKPKARAVDEAAGIQVAVSAGATVIALGSYVDVTDPTVAKAIAAAVDKNVLVVMAAPDRSAPAYPAGTDGSAVLRVGGVGVDGKLADSYRSGAVDVVAPGVDVATLGVTGTGVVARDGTSYAVAYAAAEAALVRASHPGLTASQAGHRMEATADAMSQSASAKQYGHGMIDPAASVTRVLPEEQHSVSPASDEQLGGDPLPPAGRTASLIIVGVIGLAAAGLLVLRIRRLVRPDSEPPAGNTNGKGNGDGDEESAEEVPVPSGGAER